MSRFKPEVVPYVQAHHQGGKQKPSAIILKTSFTSSAKGAALGLANYWHKTVGPSDPSHYVVDEAMTYQCVPDRTVAGAWPNAVKRALLVTICAEPVSGDRFWDDFEHYGVLHRTADLVAQLALAYKIPVRYLHPEAQEKWASWPARHRGGLFLMNNAVGDFPVNTFLIDVAAQKLIRTM